MPVSTPSTTRRPPRAGDRRASCLQQDPDLFYPNRADDPESDTAKAICRRCPIINTCLAYAVVHELEFGIFGGTDPAERRAIAAGRQPHDRRSTHGTDRLWQAFDAARRVVAGHTSRAAALHQVGRHDLAATTTVVRHAPHLADDVIAGHLSLRAAGRQALPAKKAQRTQKVAA